MSKRQFLYALVILFSMITGRLTCPWAVLAGGLGIAALMAVLEMMDEAVQNGNS